MSAARRREARAGRALRAAPVAAVARATFALPALLALALGVLAAGCGGDGPSPAPTPPIDGPAFRHLVIDPSPPGGADCCTDVCGAGDLDGDGFADLVVGGEHASGPGLYWYRYPTWQKRALAAGEFTTDLQVVDVDGDGRPDIVVGDSVRGLVWLRNPGSLDAAWDLQVIGAGYVHDLEAGDLEGDGDLDLVTCDKQQVTLWVRTGPGAWTSRRLVQRQGEGTHLADLDGDGDLDVVLGGPWFETPASPLDGAWTRHDFTTDWSADARVATGDLDGDGDLDVALTASEGDGPVAWFAAPADPREPDWPRHPVGDLQLTGAHSLRLGDLDGDGALDLATAEMHTGGRRVLVCLRRGDGWLVRELATTGSHNLRLFDLGADGDLDLAGKNYGGAGRVFEVWENLSR